MIDRLTVTDPAHTVCPWWNKIESFKDRNTFEFKPGLNILWGKNGSGKSSVISMLARLTHSQQGGVSKVTDTSLGEFGRYPEEGRFGQELLSDGQGVWYCDPSERVGLIGGSFDYDFTEIGLQNCMFKGSHGQATLSRMFAILKDMKDLKTPEITYKYKYNKPVETKDLYNYNLDLKRYEKYLLSTQYLKGPDGTLGLQPTVLFDEPDRSLDIPTQLMFWDTLTVRAQKYQIIAASHSLFALDIPGANYIEITPHYLLECKIARGALR